MKLYKIIKDPESYEKDINSLAREVNKELDRLVFTLQEMAFKETDENAARAYLDAVGEINMRFHTSYSVTIEKVKEYFEHPIPAKDVFSITDYPRKK